MASVPERQIHFLAPFVLIPRAASSLGLCVSSLVLLGWTFNIPILQSILPGQPEMVPHTAIAFILASLSLGTLNGKGKFFVVSGLCALAVTLIAVLTISEYVGGLDPGFDKLLFSQQLQISERSFPGRPS